jgi:hypothetical protein
MVNVAADVRALLQQLESDKDASFAQPMCDMRRTFEHMLAIAARLVCSEWSGAPIEIANAMYFPSNTGDSSRILMMAIDHVCYAIPSAGTSAEQVNRFVSDLPAIRDVLHERSAQAEQVDRFVSDLPTILDVLRERGAQERRTIIAQYQSLSRAVERHNDEMRRMRSRIR